MPEPTRFVLEIDGSAADFLSANPGLDTCSAPRRIGLCTVWIVFPQRALCRKRHIGIVFPSGRLATGT